MKLFVHALMKFTFGFVMVWLLLFLPADTIYYFSGWLLFSLLFFSILILGTVLFLKEPNLLAKRLDTKEKEKDQKQVICLSLLMFIVGFVVAGLDFRFGWSYIPAWMMITATIVFLGSYGLYAEVIRENAYLSRTIEIQDDQVVIDTGLYGIVRHPMYLASTMLFLSMPLVLGSWFAFLIFLIYPLLLVKRIKNEEAVLEKGLPGYIEYKQKVRYRMLPFIW